MAKITVVISVTNPPTCEPDNREISKRRGDHIEWVCADPNWMVIMQNPSPFRDNVFNASKPNSGVPRLAPDEPMTFKYTAIAGGHSADPGVIITP
jgi:hypothetical protein